MTEQTSNKFKIIHLIKIACLISIYYQIKHQNNNNEKIFNTNNEIKTRSLSSSVNLTNYNMVRFVDYEFLEFNSITIFKYFRKKFFNISDFKFDYNKENNRSKIEFNFELYDENKNLFDQKNSSMHFKFACVSKRKKSKRKKTHLIDNKYYKCFEEFDFSKPKTFGFQITCGKFIFNVFFNLADILYILGLNK